MNAMIRWMAVSVAAVGVFVMASHGAGFGAMQATTGFDDLEHLFGKDLAYSATRITTVTTQSGRPPMEMEMNFATADGNVRIEQDMTKMKNDKMPPEAISRMKQSGMDRTIIIRRKDEKLTYMIYPGMKAYCTITKEQLPGAKTEHAEPKIEKTELGKETVEGHPCIKNKVTITTEKGTTVEMLVWQATDLKQVPIKTEMTSTFGTATTILRNIKLEKPDASLFVPPSDYTKYGSMQEMMMQMMGRQIREGAAREESGITTPPATKPESTTDTPQKTQPKKRSWLPQLPELPQIPRDLIPGNDSNSNK